MDTKLYMSVFRGREDVYPVKWEKDGRIGYSFKCLNKNKAGICGHRCISCKNRDYDPVTEEVIEKHLAGEQPIGIYPLLESGYCYFIAIDFDSKDVESGQVFAGAAKLARLLDEIGMFAYIERSRGTKGYHIWVFFEEKTAAWKPREIVKYFLSKFGLNDRNKTGYDRIFPTQRKAKSLGNLIALPLAGDVIDIGGSVFVDEDDNIYPNQWGLLGSINKVEAKTIDDLIVEYNLKKYSGHLPPGDIIPGYNVKSGIELQGGLDEFCDRCDFVKHCWKNRKKIGENDWKNLISNMCRFIGGRERIHEYSKDYDGYTYDDTEAKIDHLFESSNPITCEKIREEGFDCKKQCGIRSPAAIVYVAEPVDIQQMIEALPECSDITKLDRNKLDKVLHKIFQADELVQDIYMDAIIKKYKGLKITKQGLVKKIKSIAKKEIADSRRGKLIPQGKNYVVTALDGKTEVVSSFIIKPIEIVKLPDNTEVLLCDLLTERGPSIKNVVFNRDTWNSANNFKKSLTSLDTQWTGSDNNVQFLLRLVTNDDGVNRGLGTSVYGYFKNKFVLPNMVLGASGVLEKPDVKFIPQFITDVGDRLDVRPNDDEIEDIAKRVGDDIFNLNDADTMLPLIGWFFAAPYRTIIMEQQKSGFPVLCVWGTQGSGKTSLISNVLWPMFGMKDGRPYSATQTPFTLLRAASVTNAIPIFFDEYKPNDMRKDRLDAFNRLLRCSYMGEVVQRGQSNLNVVSFKIDAPMVIAGEALPNEGNQAMGERIITSSPSKEAVATAECREAFKRISRLKLHYLAFYYYKYTLGVNVESMWEEATGVYQSFMSSYTTIPQRVETNYIIATLGIISFRDFFQAMGVSIEIPPMDSMYQSISRDILGATYKPQSSVDVFARFFAIMVSMKILEKDIHYSVARQETHKMVIIDFVPVYMKMCEYCRQVNYQGEIPTQRNTIRAAGENALNEHGYVVRDKARERVGNRKTNCMILDWNKCVDQLGVSEIVPENWGKSKRGGW